MGWMLSCGTSIAVWLTWQGDLRITVDLFWVSGRIAAAKEPPPKKSSTSFSSTCSSAAPPRACHCPRTLPQISPKTLQNNKISFAHILFRFSPLPPYLYLSLSFHRIRTQEERVAPSQMPATHTGACPAPAPARLSVCSSSYPHSDKCRALRITLLLKIGKPLWHSLNNSPLDSYI